GSCRPTLAFPSQGARAELFCRRELAPCFEPVNLASRDPLTRREFCRGQQPAIGAGSDGGHELGEREGGLAVFAPGIFTGGKVSLEGLQPIAQPIDGAQERRGGNHADSPASEASRVVVSRGRASIHSSRSRLS